MKDEQPQPNKSVPPGQMDDIACAWLARLRADDVSAEDRQAFALWLAERPEHKAAMDRVLDLWSELDVLADYADNQPVQRPTPVHTPAAGRKGWLPAGVALAASLLLAALLLPQWAAEPAIEQYRTAQGEQSQFVLPDGSAMELNTDSSVEVAWERHRRHVLLQRGEVFFTVASDKERPFIVTAGKTEVRALGTAFNVYLQGDVSEVTVTEGVVRVSERQPPSHRAAQSELLYANQYIATHRGNLGSANKVSAEVTLAWREGKLIADAMPLARLVEELSRYHKASLLIAEPELASKPVSGVFALDDLDSILLALEHSVGLRSQTLDDGSIQLITAPL